MRTALGPNLIAAALCEHEEGVGVRIVVVLCDDPGLEDTLAYIRERCPLSRHLQKNKRAICSAFLQRGKQRWKQRKRKKEICDTPLCHMQITCWSQRVPNDVASGYDYFMVWGKLVVVKATTGGFFHMSVAKNTAHAVAVCSNASCGAAALLVAVPPSCSLPPLAAQSTT